MYDAKKIISSKILKYKDGSIEIHYYDYKNELLVSKRKYKNEILTETILYDYKFDNK